MCEESEFEEWLEEICACKLPSDRNEWARIVASELAYGTEKGWWGIEFAERISIVDREWTWDAYQRLLSKYISKRWMQLEFPERAGLVSNYYIGPLVSGGYLDAIYSTEIEQHFDNEFQSRRTVHLHLTIRSFDLINPKSITEKLNENANWIQMAILFVLFLTLVAIIVQITSGQQ